MHKLSNPNLAQSKAISHGEGPMLVLAGPGSGKTFTIIQRILYLINEYHIEPQNILVITFTKSAAKEMQERFVNALDGKMLPVSFGTFHAVFFSILKYSYHLDAKSIIKESQKRDILKKIIQSLHLYDGPEMIDKMILEISKCKNLGILPEKTNISCCEQNQFIDIYKKYHDEMSQIGKIDFDDMITKCYELLCHNREVLELWQNKFQYILIDEFQDINPMQYKVIRLLSSPRHNLFVVGDDDQAIYGFRGADPKIMLSFEQDYPETKKILLNTNYRSKKDIVDLSLRLINHNENRFLKQVNAWNQVDNGVKLYCFESRDMESTNIVTLIRRYMDIPNAKYSDIAIIYRTSAHCVMTAEKMVRAGIPFVLAEKPKHIYESAVGKDIIAYIKYALDQTRQEDFYRIINRPVRYVSRESIPRKGLCKKVLIANNREKDYVIHNIIKFYNSLNFLKTMSPFAAINYIRKGIGYDEYIKSDKTKTKEEKEECFDILEQIQEMSKDFTLLPDWISFVEEYDEEMKKGMNSDYNMDAVSIVTMHAAKGLEWPFVIIPDMNEGFVPHKKAITKDEIEEERRMLYVAMTRAKKWLFLLTVTNKGDLQSLPSRFLYEIYDDLRII